MIRILASSGLTLALYVTLASLFKRGAESSAAQARQQRSLLRRIQEQLQQFSHVPSTALSRVKSTKPVADERSLSQATVEAEEPKERLSEAVEAQTVETKTGSPPGS